MYTRSPRRGRGRAIAASLVAAASAIGASALAVTLAVAHTGQPSVEASLSVLGTRVVDEPGPESVLVVDVEVRNTGSVPLELARGEFALRDAAGREHPFVTTRMPGTIPSGALTPSQTIRGLATFAVPDGVKARSLVYADKAVPVTGG